MSFFGSASSGVITLSCTTVDAVGLVGVADGASAVVETDVASSSAAGAVAGSAAGVGAGSDLTSILCTASSTASLSIAG